MNIVVPKTVITFEQSLDRIIWQCYEVYGSLSELKVELVQECFPGGTGYESAIDNYGQCQKIVANCAAHVCDGHYAVLIYQL